MGHARCSFTCSISLTTTQLSGNFYSSVLACQQHLRQEERIAKKLILTIRALMTGQQIDVVAGGFNGIAWRCSNRDNIITIDDAFANCPLPTPSGSAPLLRSRSDGRFLAASGFRSILEMRIHGALSIPRNVSVYVDRHNEKWFHLDFVDWRNTQSHHEESDRRSFLKERPAPPHQGAQNATNLQRRN